MEALDAAYEALWSAYNREHRDEMRLAIENLGKIIKTVRSEASEPKAKSVEVKPEVKPEVKK